MVKEVEEIRAEAEALALGQPECFSDGKVDVLLRRPDDAVTRSVAIASSVAGRTSLKRNHSVGHIGRKIRPVAEASLDAAGCRGRAATGSRREGRRGKVGAAERVGATAGRVDGRERKSRL